MRLIAGENAQSMTEQMSNSSWTHALTFTVRDCESLGDIWQPCVYAVKKLGKADPASQCVITICGKDDHQHFHAHGVIKSTLSVKEIRSCFSQGWADITLIRDHDRWAEYVVSQAIEGTQIDSQLVIEEE